MKRSLARRVVTIATLLSGVRIVIFAILVYAEWAGRQSISLLPLVLVLYPEGLLIGNDVTWTAWTAIGFGVLLMVGSFVLALLVAITQHLVSERRGNP